MKIERSIGDSCKSLARKQQVSQLVSAACSKISPVLTLRAPTVARLHLLRLPEPPSSKLEDIYQLLSMNLMVNLVPDSIFYSGPLYQEQHGFSNFKLQECLSHFVFCFTRGLGINVLHLCFSHCSSSLLTQVFSSSQTACGVKPNVLSCY